MQKLIDTHSHPQFPQYDEDREEVLARTREKNIALICVGTDLETSRQAVELAETHENVWASAGLHPTDIRDENYKLQITNYKKFLLHEKVVAVGEIGLDYYRVTENELRSKQREVFKQFIELALRHEKPLIIHCRDAHQDMYEILKGFMLHVSRFTLYGVIHSFTGTWEDAQKYLEVGFYIGLNGIITFPPSRKAPEGHSALLDSVKAIPLDKILLETDAPFLTPVPHRGKRNEPAYVRLVAEKLAELRGISVEEVAETTTKNAQRLFNF